MRGCAPFRFLADGRPPGNYYSVKEAGEVTREKAAIKKLAAQFNSVTLEFLRGV
jgi:hypothetical protein